MRTWKRRLGVLALPVLLCAACSEPHSGDWAPQSPPDTTQAMPSPSTLSASPEPSSSGTAPSEQASVTPLSELEQWLLQGFQDAGYASSTVRVQGYKEAWVGSGSEESAPERLDRKSTRLNSSHVSISYAVFCLKKKSNKRAR